MVKPIPDGYQVVTPYLVNNGVANLIDFLRNAFDAKERSRHARPDGTIMHAEVQVGDTVIMLGEATSEWPARPATLHLYSTDVDDSYRRAMDAGASTLREPATQFYGDRMAGVRDPSGNDWWIATHVEDVAPEEMQRRAAQQSAG